MPRASFYLIDKPRFRTDPLLLVCELVRRAYEARQPLLILARDETQAAEIDGRLWEFDENAYIPHQIAGDADDEVTAVLIVPPGTIAADRPLLINLRDELPDGAWERVIEVVPAEEGARAGSRERWKAYRARGIETEKHDM